MRKKFKNILYLISLLIISAFVLGILYFVYLRYISGNGEVKQDGALSINYLDGSKIVTKKNKTTKISIINTSEEDAYYYLAFEDLKNVNETNTYTIKFNNNETSNSLNSFNNIALSYILIHGGEKHDYEITFKSNEKNKYRLKINVALDRLETNTFAETILKNNKIKDQSTTIVGKEIATTDEGLIRSLDDDGITYYFRGNVNNNNVIINGLKFKIVRINGDGSVRLILDDTIKLSKYSSTNNYAFEKSDIYKTLTEWLETNFKEYTKYLTTKLYCNDNNEDNDRFLALTRIKIDNIPSFVCLGHAFNTKVGLLTVDEVVYAGATLDEENKNFYLYNANLKNDAYLMTGSSLRNNKYYPFMISTKGQITYNTSSDYLRAVRPVININKSITVVGNGTSDNPYMLTIES